MIVSQCNGRRFDDAVIHGHPIEIIRDAQICELGSWGVPRGTPHLDEVLEFIRFATPPDFRFLPPASSARRALRAPLVRSVPRALPPIA